jgi:hypothetical protein
MENPLPSAESLKKTALEVLRTAGRIVTLRCFLPEQPLASHGDHLFEHPLDEPVEQVTDWPEKRPCPDVAGRDVSRGWTDQGEYLERD